MLAESVVLLGQGLYKTIPDEIKLNAVPTASELEYVGSEDFDSTMVRNILPKVVEDSGKMDFTELLEIDYDWICRCLRLKSYGPYVHVNRIFCPDCNDVHEGDYQVDLRNVGINPLPKDFVDKITIKADEFIGVKDDLVLTLLTVKDKLAMAKDKMFDRPDGSKNVMLARICYMTKQIGQKQNLTPIDVRTHINKNFSAADYEILKDLVGEADNYGIRMMGNVVCPVCKSNDAYFVALRSDKFFRPTVGDVRAYKSAIRSGDWKELPGDPAGYVRNNS